MAQFSGLTSFLGQGGAATDLDGVSAMSKGPDYRGVAKVFWSGRLPAACRFETSEVEVIKEGDRLTLLPRGKNWGAYFDSKSRGSLPARSQPPP